MAHINRTGFLNLTADGANDREFPEFRVDDIGIWLKYSYEEIKSLTKQERFQILKKDKGEDEEYEEEHEYEYEYEYYDPSKPLLEFPCTRKQLVKLLADFGYWGILDDEKSAAEAMEAIRPQDDERRAKGRYTLEEAAKLLEKEGRAREERMTEKLVKAVEVGKLAAYEPGADDRYLGKQTRTYYEEVYWDDLNDWLAKNESRIEWRFPAPQQNDEDEILNNGVKCLGESAPIEKIGAVKPLPRQQAQEQEILRVIRELGYDSQNLPKPPKGDNQGGVKAEVRKQMKGPLWQGNTIFDKAWERLRKQREIQDAS